MYCTKRYSQSRLWVSIFALFFALGIFVVFDIVLIIRGMIFGTESGTLESIKTFGQSIPAEEFPVKWDSFEKAVQKELAEVRSDRLKAEELPRKN